MNEESDSLRIEDAEQSSEDGWSQAFKIGIVVGLTSMIVLPKIFVYILQKFNGPNTTLEEQEAQDVEIKRRQLSQAMSTLHCKKRLSHSNFLRQTEIEDNDDPHIDLEISLATISSEDTSDSNSAICEKYDELDEPSLVFSKSDSAAGCRAGAACAICLEKYDAGDVIAWSPLC